MASHSRKSSTRGVMISPGAMPAGSAWGWVVMVFSSAPAGGAHRAPTRRLREECRAERVRGQDGAGLEQIPLRRAALGLAGRRRAFCGLAWRRLAVDHRTPVAVVEHQPHGLAGL